MKQQSRSQQTQAKSETLQLTDKAIGELLEHSPLPMFIHDAESLRFLDVNSVAIEKYGYSRQEFLEMTVADIRPPEEVSRLKEAVRTRQGLQAAGEWLHRLKDGRLRNMQITTLALDWRGVKAILVLAEDITDRKQTEEAAREKADSYYRLFENLAEGFAMLTVLESAFRQGNCHFGSPASG